MLDWGILMETIQTKMDMFLYQELPNRAKTAAIRYHDEERALENSFAGQGRTTHVVALPTPASWKKVGVRRRLADENDSTGQTESKVWMKGYFSGRRTFRSFT